MSDLKLVAAYHEAGHAVMAEIQGCPVEAASILESDDSAGTTSYKSPYQIYEEDDAIRREILISLSGGVAEQFYSIESWCQDHTISDFNEAADCVLRISGSAEDANRKMDALLAETESTLRNTRIWSQVAAVAALLFERHQVIGDEIREAMARAIGEEQQ